MRIPPDLKDQIQKAAEDADQSVTEYVLHAVKLRLRGAAEVTHVFRLEGLPDVSR